eukprot:365869-Chlamydomonas_euryale.AAC.9
MRRQSSGWWAGAQLFNEHPCKVWMSFSGRQVLDEPSQQPLDKPPRQVVDVPLLQGGRAWVLWRCCLGEVRRRRRPGTNTGQGLRQRLVRSHWSTPAAHAGAGPLRCRLLQSPSVSGGVTTS